MKNYTHWLLQCVITCKLTNNLVYNFDTENYLKLFFYLLIFFFLNIFLSLTGMCIDMYVQLYDMSLSADK